MDIFSQSVGLLAFIIEALSVQCKKRMTILAWLFLAALLFAVHFVLIGAYTGAAMNLISAVRLLMFLLWRERNPSKSMLMGISLLFVGAGVITWQGWLSSVPIVAMLFTTYGMWQKDEQVLRKTFLVSSPLWLLYTIITGSIGGILTECLSLVSTSVALWRYRANKRLDTVNAPIAIKKSFDRV